MPKGPKNLLRMPQETRTKKGEGLGLVKRGKLQEVGFRRHRSPLAGVWGQRPRGSGLPYPLGAASGAGIGGIAGAANSLFRIK